jgi:hypothetical protein
MKKFQIVAFAAIATFAQAASADTATECPTDGYGPSRYQVYVDPPSGDAYIRTPCGWRFVRTIEPERIAEAIRLVRVHPADLERESAVASHVGQSKIENDDTVARRNGH